MTTTNLAAEELLETRAALSVTEVARLLGVSRNSVYTHVASGAIASTKVGKRVVIPTSAVREMLAGPTQQALDV